MNNPDLISLSYLDQIPDKIYQRLITHQYRFSSAGVNKNSLQLRAQGILHIRNQLLNAKNINQSSLMAFFDEGRVDFICRQLNNNKILDKTFNNEPYTDDVLLQVLNWLDQIDAHKNHQNNAKPNLFDSDIDNRLKRSMQDINKSFKLERQLGWDLTNGVRTKTDLNKLVETHRVIKVSKKLQSIIRLIGRGYRDRYEISKHAGINRIEKDTGPLNQTLPDDNSVNSVTGVCLGDDVSRMLASELSLLANKKLKILWHAKRAERHLLNYHYQGLLSDHVPDIQAESLKKSNNKNQFIENRGPIILCIDTSASMKGRPEVLSKAIAFEVMRVAYLEKRSCHLVCFSGEGEFMQLDLDFNLGWDAILEFLSFSFNGGTDINGAMLNVLEKYNAMPCNNSDIVLVSDGRFEVENELLEKISHVNDSMKILGIQLGKWNAQSLGAICHIVYDLSDV